MKLRRRSKNRPTDKVFRNDPYQLYCEEYVHFGAGLYYILTFLAWILTIATVIVSCMDEKFCYPIFITSSALLLICFLIKILDEK